MEIAYITTQKAKVSKYGDALVVRLEGRKLNTVPLAELKSLVIIGNAQLTTQIIHKLMSLGINIYYLNHAGQLIGVTNSDMSGNVILRIAQYKKWQEEAFRVSYAKTMLTRKIKGQIDVLKSYAQNRDEQRTELEPIIVRLKQQVLTIHKAKSISEAMGYEGIAARYYFSGYNKLLLHGFIMTKREHRPAFEPVNALLNYGYAFLRNEIITRLYAFGFELELGFIHGVRYGRDSLALDIMELFRPLFADKLVLQLINKKMIREEHFIIDSEGCRLTQEGVGIFCNYYYKYIQKKNHEGKTWNQQMDYEIKKLRKSIMT